MVGDDCRRDGLGNGVQSGTLYTCGRLTACLLRPLSLVLGDRAIRRGAKLQFMPGFPFVEYLCVLANISGWRTQCRALNV
jgi:hypothetical protein